MGRPAYIYTPAGNLGKAGVVSPHLYNQDKKIRVRMQVRQPAGSKEKQNGKRR